jgi:hypothetical protein
MPPTKKPADKEKKRGSRSVVSIANGVYDRAKELSALASQHGWQILGSDRTDPPHIGAIFDEGIRLLSARLKPTKGSK